MPLIRLISQNREQARKQAAILTKSGCKVDASPLSPKRLIGQFRDRPPAAILIDLDQLPSFGRAVATMLRSSKSTRHIPIVFAGGAEDKIQRTRREVPAALFTDWPRVLTALKQAVRMGPVNPPPAKSYMDQYAGSSLVKKLDFKPNMKAALLAAPDGFEEQLADLPDGVDLETRIRPDTRMAIWFVRSRLELEDGVYFLSARLPQGASLWIVYPKRTSRFKVDFTQKDVRAAGLAAGLTDYKICAVDSDWTGLKFIRKKA